MKKIVVMMTYFNRQYQLNKTLDSISKSKYKNFEVVIVDDGSDNKITLSKNYPYKISLFRLKKMDHTCPIVAYNYGLNKALKKGADIIVIQNAECIHQGDIISYAASIKRNEYITFACFSLDEQNTFSEKTNLLQLLREYNKPVNGNGENGWYNHSLHRNVYYDFCACITKENIINLNGYDERYATGIAYADNDFLERVQKLKLDIRIIDDPFVVHQWHYTENMYTSDELLFKNRDLFCEIRKKDIYKAEHIYTKNLSDE